MPVRSNWRRYRMASSTEGQVLRRNARSPPGAADESESIPFFISVEPARLDEIQWHDARRLYAIALLGTATWALPISVAALISDSSHAAVWLQSTRGPRRSRAADNTGPSPIARASSVAELTVFTPKARPLTCSTSAFKTRTANRCLSLPTRDRQRRSNRASRTGRPQFH